MLLGMLNPQLPDSLAQHGGKAPRKRSRDIGLEMEAVTKSGNSRSSHEWARLQAKRTRGRASAASAARTRSSVSATEVRPTAPET